MGPLIEYAEKNGIIRIDYNPNDERLDEQWALFEIDAPEAWDIATGNAEIVIAVLDTGIVPGHPDLAANIWVNPYDPDVGEGYEGVDNDLNGFPDDINGWDFVNNDNEPYDDNSEGFVYHGTSVSGIIGAEGDNEIGISGVNWNVKLMPVKVCNQYGECSVSDAINGIDYAIANGAFLINAGWHIEDNDQALKSAVTRALSKNRLFVCAAGNAPYGLPNGWNIDDPNKGKSYPSNWTLDNIISVLATYLDSGTEKRVSQSHWGPTSVDIGAPGWDILTTKGGEYPYLPFAQTSAATPHVSGVAALALGICPGLTSSRLKNLIIQNDDNIPDLSGKCTSNGRLNAYEVLNALTGSATPNAPSNLIAFPVAWNIIGVRWNDNSNNELGFEIQRKNENQPAFFHDNCVDINSTSLASFQDTVEPTLQLTYSYRVRAANRAGISAFSNTYSAMIPFTVPDAPTDLSGQSPTLEQNVNISWSNHATNALFNYVERRTLGEEEWEVVMTLAYNADIFSDIEAQAGYTYQYRLRAGNPLGYSAYSNIISIEVIEW